MFQLFWNWVVQVSLFVNIIPLAHMYANMFNTWLCAGSLLVRRRLSGVYISFLISTNIQRKHWRQMSKFTFLFLGETTDVPNGGHHCAPFCLWFCSYIFLSSEDPGVSKHTQTCTDTHQRMHKYTFGPDFFFFSPSLSICGVFKYQSRVV